jgi:hypothetical protein
MMSGEEMSGEESSAILRSEEMSGVERKLRGVELR